mmetsp:Transcript_9166/g.20240  ORF Transcript_9166/g.20240 Transcript_9166/m.20240 type:complete len:298 (-) Transcript_9166:583-1476(-)
MHQYAAYGVLVAGDEDPLALGDRLRHDLFGVEGYGSVHARLEGFGLGELAVHLEPSVLDAAEQRLGQGVAHVLDVFFQAVVVARIVSGVGGDVGGRHVVAAAPDLEPVLAVDVPDHFLALPRERPVVSLVEPPALDEGQPVAVELLHDVVRGLYGAREPAGVDDVELETVLLQQFSAGDGISDAVGSEGGVLPSCEEGELVMGGSSVANEDHDRILFDIDVVDDFQEHSSGYCRDGIVGKGRLSPSDIFLKIFRIRFYIFITNKSYIFVGMYGRFFGFCLAVSVVLRHFPFFFQSQK